MRIMSHAARFSDVESVYSRSSVTFFVSLWTGEDFLYRIIHSDDNMYWGGPNLCGRILLFVVGFHLSIISHPRRIFQTCSGEYINEATEAGPSVISVLHRASVFPLYWSGMSHFRATGAALRAHLLVGVPYHYAHQRNSGLHLERGCGFTH